MLFIAGFIIIIFLMSGAKNLLDVLILIDNIFFKKEKLPDNIEQLLLGSLLSILFAILVINTLIYFIMN